MREFLVLPMLVMLSSCQGAPPAQSVAIAPASAPPIAEEGRAQPIGRAHGCREPADLDASIEPMVQALNKVGATIWRGSREHGDRWIRLRPSTELPARSAAEITPWLDALNPFVVGGATAPATAIDVRPGHPNYCRPIFLRGSTTKTLHGLCVDMRGDKIDEVRVDVSRRFDVFAQLLRISEVDARRIAIEHAEKKLRRDTIRFDSAVLLTGCDMSLAAKSLVYRVDLVSDGVPDTVEVDATSGEVVTTKTLPTR